MYNYIFIVIHFIKKNILPLFIVHHIHVPIYSPKSHDLRYQLISSVHIYEAL